MDNRLEATASDVLQSAKSDAHPSECFGGYPGLCPGTGLPLQAYARCRKHLRALSSFRPGGAR